MENRVTVELMNLTTGYVTRSNRVIIEKNVDAVLHEGEFCCLLGPNGAGKSTFVAHVIRLLCLRCPELSCCLTGRSVHIRTRSFRGKSVLY